MYLKGTKEMNITEIKKPPRNAEARELLQAITQHVEDNENTTNMLVLVKVNGEYLRYTTSIDNAIEVIGQLELAKYDTLKRMDT
jgi:hypothetical protein